MADFKVVEMKKVQEFDINDENIKKIQTLNSRLVAVKNLMKEFGDNDSQAAFSRLVDELGKTQEAYDQWFADMQELLSITTNENQSWNVDFVNKKLQLIG